MNWSFLRNRVFWLNVSFWLLFFSYKFYDFAPFMGETVALKRIGVPMFFHIILSYVHYLFVLPDLLRTKRLLLYFSRLIPLIAIVMFFQVQAENYVFVDLSRGYYNSFGWTRFVSTLWDELSFMIFTGMIKFAADWFELENKKKELENQKLTAELNYLKAQINPHFLFNTLHNLNYLTQAKKDQATEVVIKLSNIMRYMIYDANKSTVAIHKEIEYIKDYLDLEQIRLNNVFKINFKHDVQDDQTQVIPLVLIPLVENAFKHGISDKEPEGWININLSITDGSLRFHVENSLLKQQLRQDLPSGFGLDNLKKRLTLTYPERHTLQINEDQDQYSVVLEIRFHGT